MTKEPATYISSLQTRSRVLYILMLSTNQSQQTPLSVKGQAVSFFLCLLKVILSLSFFPVHPFPQSRCFLSALPPPPRSRTTRSPVLRAAGTRTCQGRARARPRGGTGGDVAGSSEPARPADVTATAAPGKARGWESEEGNTAGTPRPGLSAAAARRALRVWGRRAGIAPPAPAEAPHALRALERRRSVMGEGPARRPRAHAPCGDAERGEG